MAKEKKLNEEQVETKPEAEVKEEPAKESKYPYKSLQLIEDSRWKFWRSYKFHNTIKMLLMMLCIVAIIISFIVLPNAMPGNTTLQYSLSATIAVVVLGGSLLYGFYMRKKFDRLMKEYFTLYFNSINEYVFQDKGFKDVELQEPGKITVEEFQANNLYKDIVESGSRGLTTYKYNGVEMSIVDCSGNVKDAKRMKPVFVGKMVRANASYKGKEPVVIYLKGNDRALPPTNLDELKVVSDDKVMNIYSNYKDWKKVLNTKVMKAVESIKTNNILIDVAITVFEGKLFIMLGYDDPLMVLPLQNEFDYKPTDVYKKDLLVVSKLVEAFNK